MRKQIILAVANGCTSTRQIAKHLNKPLSTINNYFYNSNNSYDTIDSFINGYILQWTQGKANTLRLVNGITRIWRGDKVVDVYGRLELK